MIVLPRHPAQLLMMMVFTTSLTLPTSFGGASQAMGKLEVRVTDHKPAIEQFRRLEVTLEAIALHEKGKGRSDGWVEITTTSPPIDIVPLKDGVYQSLGVSSVPLGDYDAVSISFAKLGSELKTGEEAVTWPDDTIVRIDVAITEQENLPLVLDLYAEDQTEHDPPRYMVKVKGVRLGR